MRGDEHLQKVTQEELKTGYRVQHPVSHFSTLPFSKKIANLHALVSYSCTVTLSFHKVKLWKLWILQMPPSWRPCLFFHTEAAKTNEIFNNIRSQTQSLQMQCHCNMGLLPEKASSYKKSPPGEENIQYLMVVPSVNCVLPGVENRHLHHDQNLVMGLEM